MRSRIVFRICVRGIYIYIIMCVKRLWCVLCFFFFFSSRRRHTRYWRDWSSDVCSSDLTDSEDEQEIKDGWPMIATRIFPLQRQFNFLNKWKAYSPTKRFLAQFELFQEMRQQLTQCFIAHTTLNYIRILVGTYHDLYPLFVNILKSLRFLKI